HAAHNIAQACPQAKIIMILRNPVECVLSMYSMMRRYQREPCEEIADAFRDSPRRMAAGWEWAWDYQNYFLYASQVARYLDLFPNTQNFYPPLRRVETPTGEVLLGPVGFSGHQGDRFSRGESPCESSADSSRDAEKAQAHAAAVAWGGRSRSLVPAAEVGAAA